MKKQKRAATTADGKPFHDERVKERQLKALEEMHGIWKDDAEIEDAFKEVEQGWEAWRKQLEKS